MAKPKSLPVYLDEKTYDLLASLAAKRSKVFHKRVSLSRTLIDCFYDYLKLASKQ